MSKRKRRRRKISLETILGLMNRAEYEAAKYGRLVDNPEDAKQEYASRVLSGLHQRATVQQAMLDMVREKSDPRRPGYEQQKALHLAAPVDPEKILSGHNPTNSMNTNIFLQQAIEHLDERGQGIMLLYLQGYTIKEIAECYSVTEACIHNQWHKYVSLIKRFADAPTKIGRRI